MQRNIQRMFSNVAWSHSASRKDLIPLIKYLHPDLLVQKSEKIRSQNMTCIQNLNDLWDSLEININAIAGRCSNMVDLRMPFRADYDLSCFLSRTSQSTDEEGNSLTKIKFILKAPQVLQSKSALTCSVLQSGINNILDQQGQLMVAAGLKYPWPELLKINDMSVEERKGKIGLYPAETNLENVSPEIDRRIFDRWASKNMEHNINNQHIYAGKNIVRRGGRKQLQTYSILGDKLPTMYFSDEVDTFISNGNIMTLPPMSPTEEYEAAHKFRQFLVDYGDVLDFSVRRWCTVVFILHIHVKQQIVPSNNNYDDNNNDNNTEMASDNYNAKEQQMLQETGGYSVQCIEQQHYIMKVPTNFKTKKILAIIRQYLPVSKLSLNC